MGVEFDASRAELLAEITEHARPTPLYSRPARRVGDELVGAGCLRHAAASRHAKQRAAFRRHPGERHLGLEGIDS